MSISIKWKQAHQGQEFAYSTVQRWKALTNVFGGTPLVLDKSNIPILRAMGHAEGAWSIEPFYFEIANKIEDVGSIELWLWRSA